MKRKFKLNVSLAVIFFFSSEISILSQNTFTDKLIKQVTSAVKNSNQIVLVTSPDWNSTEAKLQYFEKNTNKWNSVSNSFAVNLGRKGLGWGRGLVNFNTATGPIKHEGDGKSPTGIFKLSYAFGFASNDSSKWIKLPYLQLTNSIECIDDTISSCYNTVVDSKNKISDWASSEKMRKIPEYKYGVFVEHNTNPNISAKGSCIFLHVWKGPGKPTSGCTSMSEENMVKLLSWLNAKKKPILIQLTNSEFENVKMFLKLN